MKGNDPAVVDALRSATSPDRVRVGSTELGLYRRDASNLDGDAGVVCFPLTTEEVQDVVRVCQRFGVPFVISTDDAGVSRSTLSQVDSRLSRSGPNGRGRS